MNRFQEKLGHQQGVLGTFFHLGSTVAAECMAAAGMDFAIIDMEHGPFSEESTVELMRAMELHGCAPVVRVREGGRAAVLRALDIGAQALVVPDVHSLEEVKKLVEYAKFPPEGRRGFAFARSAIYGLSPHLTSVSDYFAASNKILLLPQCETLGALEQIEEIAALPGVDGIFVGPYDLSVAMGKPAQFVSEEFQAALARIQGACKKAGKLLFIYADNISAAKTYFKQGYHGVAVSTDTSVLIKGIKAMLQEYKE